MELNSKIKNHAEFFSQPTDESGSDPIFGTVFFNKDIDRHSEIDTLLPITVSPDGGKPIELVHQAPDQVVVVSSTPTEEKDSDIVDITDFSVVVCPLASTDYKGLERIDRRLVDREWRLNNLYTVIDDDGNLVRFKLRPAQRNLLDNMHHRNIILKARQLGFTTFICVLALDYALFNSNKNIGIIAHSITDASVIFKKVKVAWENFPEPIKEFLMLKTVGDSKAEYEFSNGSSMRIATSLRSGTYQFLLLTEFGKVCARFPEKADEIVTGALPAVTKNGIAFIESTAEGESGQFYDFCQDAMEAKRVHRPLSIKEYKFHFYAWFENPANVMPGNIDIPREELAYFDKIEALISIKLSQEQRNWYYLEHKVQKGKMTQEHPSTPEEAFLSSGNKLFNGEMIDKHRIEFKREPIEIDGDFLIYAHFVKGHMYGLGADVSQGVKRDSSTIVIIDFTTGEVVLTYRSDSIDPVTFAYEIKKAGSWYGICIAAPEVNNVGLTTCIQLQAIYPNMYTQVRQGITEDVSTNKLGWLTTSLTKPKMMYELSEAIADSELIIPDEGILLEAKKFNKDDTLVVTVNSNTTRHFDLLTACAIAWQMKTYMGRGMASEEEVDRIETNRANRRVQKNKYR